MSGSRVLGEAAEGTGIVHLGAGAFARAHVWWATALAVDAAGGPWGVLAVGQRSGRVVEALRRRDWRYDVRLVGAGRDTTDTVALVDDGLVALEQPQRLQAALASERTRIVTVTATEAAYRPGCGAETVVGQLVAAAGRRRERGCSPLSVLACDNVAHGGTRLQELAVAAARELGHEGAAEELGRWAFPTSVVDRVVPAVPAEQQPDVVADPVFRWVVEDDFAGPRPAWEAAGVQLVPDADPWQQAKLLLVNAPHSLVAYVGLALGHRTVEAAMADGVVHDVVEQFLGDELVGCVPVAPGLDAATEAAGTLERFTHQVVPHALHQVGADGSAKLPQRLRAPLRRHLDGEAGATWSALVVAAWVLALERGDVEDDRGATLLHGAAPASRARRALEVLDVPHDAETLATLVADWLGALGAGEPATVRSEIATRLSTT